MEFKPDALLRCLRADLREFVDGNNIDWFTDNPKRFAAQSLCKNLLKKYRKANTRETDSAALKTFLAVNSRMSEFKLEFNFEAEAEVFGLMRVAMDRFFNEAPFDFTCYDHILDSGAVGPGASIGAHGTDFYTKLFSSPMVVYTPRSFAAYEIWSRQYPRWHSAELERRLHFGSYFDLDERNKLAFVPKNDETSRTICVEPALEMFIQRGIGDLITRRLRSVYNIRIEGDGVDNQQVHNRALARAGSIDGSFCTIDLSSASDSLSRTLMCQLLPQNIFWLLESHSARATRLPTGRTERLGMLSTMGNGFTFPLQTLVFASLVTSVYRFLGIPILHGRSKRGRNYGVFGDDIIVVPEAASLVLRMLKTLGFVPNPEKTFVEGPFRESCGGDYLRGHDVRPVFIKDLSTQAGRYVAVNLLTEWSALHGLPLPTATEWLLQGAKHFVPPGWPIDSGVRVPSFLVRSFMPVDKNGSFVVRALEPRAEKLRIEDTRIVVRKGQRSRHFNAEGLYLSYLRGDIRNCSITIRSNRVSYRTRSRVCPNWDYYDAAFTRYQVSWQRWKTAASGIGTPEE